MLSTEGSRRILVVDDDNTHREIIDRYLRKTLKGRYGVHAEVVTAGDGATALGILTREGPFDLVTTDNYMPFMDGPRLVAAIRRGDTDVGPRLVRPLDGTSVVLQCDGRKKREDVPDQGRGDRSTFVGADYYLGPPVDLRRLGLVVAEFLAYPRLGRRTPETRQSLGRLRRYFRQQVHCVDPSSLTSRVPQLYTTVVSCTAGYAPGSAA